MKYYREVKASDLHLWDSVKDTIIAYVEPREITEEEIEVFINECEDAYGRPASLAVEIGISWIMDKLNQQK